MLHISPEITIYILTITFILGCCLGSFADCAAGRLLSGESVVAGRSHCDHCGHVLGVLDLIPLFSWLLLKDTAATAGQRYRQKPFLWNWYRELPAV